MTKRGCRAAGISAAGVILLLGGAARAGLCGWCVNAATVGDGIVFDELNVKGTARPGSQGPRILKNGEVVMADGNRAKLQVNRHFLSAVSPTKTYTYDELEGMRFTLGMDDGRKYEVLLKEVKGCLHSKEGDQQRREEKKCTPLRFWATPHEEIPQYDFVVRKTSTRTPPAPSPPAVSNPKVASPRRPVANARENYKPEQALPLETDDRPIENEFKEHLCKGEFTDKDVLWGDLKDSAMTFEGDHYDRPTKKVRPTKHAEGYFNLACFGAAVAKMHLLRHTAAGAITPDGTIRKTTIAERTAMLKAITADYCGDGTAWTGDGTPLMWTDANGWFPRPKLDLTALANNGLIEAVWGPEGALCLNEPRRQPATPGLTWPSGACTAPAVTRAEVELACKKSRTFSAAPGATSPPTAIIPKCDKAWVSYWPRAKTSGGRVHVISANVAGVARNYCDMPPRP